MLALLFFVIWLAILGFCGFEGLWGNVLRLVNVTLAALIATNCFEPAAVAMEKQFPSWKYHVDIVAMLAVFALAMAILRLATDMISKVKVRFIPPVDRAGALVVSGITGLVFLSFFMTALHTAPLGKEFLGFDSYDVNFLGFQLDKQWLGFMQRQSRGGAFSSGDWEENPAHVFDPNAEFVPKYLERREEYDKLPSGDKPPPEPGRKLHN